MPEKTATFGIKIPVSTNADESSTSVDKLRKSIESSQTAVKNYGATLRALTGKSEEVKAAREKLKAAMGAEKDAISRNILAIGKQGKTLVDTGKKTKEATDRIDAIKDALSSAGGPLAAVSGKFETFSGLITGAGGAAALGAAAVGLLAVAVVAVGAAALVAAGSLAKFMISAGSELRTLDLLRESFSGSAENATAWGHQLDAIQKKVGLSTKELNTMQNELEKTFGNSRVGETAVVSLANAMAQVSHRGNDAQAELKAVAEAGKLTGRIGFDIRNGLSAAFGNNGGLDIAHQLAQNLKISDRDAQVMISSYRVPVEEGLKAMQQVSEGKYGKINQKLMLDFDKQAQRLSDNWAKLTKGFKDTALAPILEGFAKLGALFDENTFTGNLLKETMTDFGAVMKTVFQVGLPFVEAFFNQIIIEALKLEIAMLRVAVWVKQTFGVDFADSLLSAQTAIDLAKFAMWSFVAVMGAAVVVVGLAAAPFVALGVAFYELHKYSMKFGEYLKGINWSEIGSNMIDGLLNGIKSAATAIPNAITGVADSIKQAFSKALDIHSPSKLFEKYGEYTVQGYVDGVDGNRDAAGASVAKMVSLPAGGGGGGGGLGGGGPVSVTVNLEFPNAKSGSDVASALTSTHFKAEFARILEELMLGSGAPTMAPQGGIT